MIDEVPKAEGPSEDFCSDRQGMLRQEDELGIMRSRDAAYDK
jgi:hypothetical protein